MINKKVTISASDINDSFSGEFIDIDPKKEITETVINETVVKTLYPISIKIYNDSGAEIGYNPVLTEQEYNYYLANPSELVFQKLTKDFLLQTDHTNFSKCYRFLIKANEASATKQLDIEFINYRQ